MNSEYNDIIFYNNLDGDVKIEVIYNNETFWLSQKRMAELFACSTDNISLHIKNIFKGKELDSDSVTEEFSATAADGKNYKTKFYNLDAIIAVGYRINSYQATQFRIWATKTLREFIIKGFVLDDERLKQGKRFGKDYFDELLERIREIRASERRFYLKITDIYEQCSIDYNKDAGKISHEVAMKLVEKEYEKFRVIQDQNFVSDFEQEVKKLGKANKSDKKK